MTEQQKSAAKLLEASAQKLKELKDKKAADKIYYDPEPADLYVCEVVFKRTLGGFHGHTHTYNKLCLTDELGWKWAAHELKRCEAFGKPWHGVGTQDEALALFEAGKYQECVASVTRHSMEWYIKVATVSVSATGEPPSIF